MNRQRFFSPVLLSSVALAAALVAPTAAATTISPTGTRDQAAPLAFQGRYLVSISDADMLASAYVDGELGLRDEGRDALSVIPLGGDPRDWRASETEVSNSVAPPPTALAVTPDGRWAFVTEMFGQASSEATTFADLPLGNRVTAVDLSNPTEPRVVGSIDLGNQPESVEVSPDGRTLLVTVSCWPAACGGPAENRPVAFIPWNDGTFGQPTFSTFPGIASDVRVSHAVWHPSGEYVAGTLVDQGRVVFARVERDADRIILQPWGDATIVGKFPFKILFTPDGRHLLTTNLQWGSDVAGFWIEAPRGQIGVVRFSATPDENGQLRHPVVAYAETGVSPEGITISRDGRYVVTTNLERSYLPYNDQRITWYSSLTLLRMDPNSGYLESLGEYLYDGILPEAATFDASGQYVAVVSFDHFDDRQKGGSVDFWRVVSDPQHPTPRLVKTEYSVAVTRGAHSMVLVP